MFSVSKARFQVEYRDEIQNLCLLHFCLYFGVDSGDKEGHWILDFLLEVIFKLSSTRTDQLNGVPIRECLISRAPLCARH